MAGGWTPATIPMVALPLGCRCRATKRRSQSPDTQNISMTSSIVHIVDDDEGTRRGTSRLLEAAGLEARTYASAGEFLSSIEPASPGCIVLDVQLPDQNGLELQAALAVRGTSLPIIFVTGHGQ